MITEICLGCGDSIRIHPFDRKRRRIPVCGDCERKYTADATKRADAAIDSLRDYMKKKGGADA